MFKHIFLTGFMGSGKTTIGKKIAERMNWPFYDCDQEIERRSNCTIPEIFEHEGERQFRIYEQGMISELAEREQPAVIALGGGALLTEGNVETVKQHGRLIYLKTHPDQIWQRVRFDHNRPLLGRGQKFLSKEEFDQKVPPLMADREKGYLQADIIIDCGLKKATEIAEQIINRLYSGIESQKTQNGGHFKSER